MNLPNNYSSKQPKKNKVSVIQEAAYSF